MTKHSPEPWTIDKWGDVVDANGEEISEGDGNYDHLLACVNACRGINPAAVPELHAACEAVARIGYQLPNTLSDVMPLIRAALALAKPAVRKGKA